MTTLDRSDTIDILLAAGYVANADLAGSPSGSVAQRLEQEALAQRLVVLALPSLSVPEQAEAFSQLADGVGREMTYRNDPARHRAVKRDLRQTAELLVDRERR